MKKKNSSYSSLLQIIVWLVALKIVPDSLLGVTLLAPIVVLIYHLRNKIIDYENKSSIWKQAFIIGFFTLGAIILYSVNIVLTSSSDIRGLAILIPFLLIEFLFKNINIKLPTIFSVSLSLLIYYIFGIMVAFIINRFKKIN